MLVRHLSTIAVGAAATVVLTATAASGHFSYFSDPNPNGDAGRAGRRASCPRCDRRFGGVCPAGAEILADAGGIPALSSMPTV